MMFNKIRKTKSYQLCGRMGLIVGVTFLIIYLITTYFFNSFKGPAIGFGVFLFLLPLYGLYLYVFIYYIIRLVGIHKDYKKKNYVNKCNVWYDVGFLFITLLFLLLLYFVLYLILSVIGVLGSPYNCYHFWDCESVPVSVCDAATYQLNGCQERVCRPCVPCQFCDYIFLFKWY